eukprot:1267412-Rhodomonas_salina.1
MASAQLVANHLQPISASFRSATPAFFARLPPQGEICCGTDGSAITIPVDSVKCNAAAALGFAALTSSCLSPTA